MGQVAFSSTIQLCMRTINSWYLLVKFAKGQKVSSRSLKKDKIDASVRTMGLTYLEEQLYEAYKNYNQAKANDVPLRENMLYTRAEAHAAENNIFTKKMEIVYRCYDLKKSRTNAGRLTQNYSPFSRRLQLRLQIPRP
jgi:hypothetical protein